MDMNLLSKRGLELYEIAKNLHNNKDNSFLKEAIITKIKKDFKKQDIDVIFKALISMDAFEKKLLSKVRLKKSMQELDKEETDKYISNFDEPIGRGWSARSYKIYKNLEIRTEKKGRSTEKYLIVNVFLGKNFLNDYLKLDDISEEEMTNLLSEDGFLHSYMKYRVRPRFDNLINKWTNEKKKSKIKFEIENIKRYETGYGFNIIKKFPWSYSEISEEILKIHGEFLSDIRKLMNDEKLCVTYN